VSISVFTKNEIISSTLYTQTYTHYAQTDR